MDEPGLPPDAIGMFLSAAARRPDSIAVDAAGEQSTYKALEGLARRYGAAFAAVAAPRILIVLPRGLHAYAAMLGAGLAGGFYAPVNDAAPEEKLLSIAAQFEPNIIVAGADTARSLAAHCRQAICIDPANLPAVPGLAGAGRRHRTAYVIFTSGSTGKPKGVVIPRAALDHYVSWIGRAGRVTPNDRVAQFSNLGFDFSVFDIYGSLCLGAALIPINGRVDRMFPARAVARERITFWASVPSVVTLMMNAEDVTFENLRTVRHFMFCGEPLLREHVEALFAANPRVVVENTYGPTEATVTMTSLLLTQDSYAAACGGASVAFGSAIGGMDLHLVGGATPDEGEIVITGPQLADGYWRDPERTAKSFRDFELDGRVARRFFSGDWAERRGGHIYFKERMDFQVKVRGYRIELDEVAGAIRKCGWPTVCVFKWNDRLAALVECAAGRAFDAAALRDALAVHIEPYAIPEEIHPVDRVPRNENDKIDRTQAARLLETLVSGGGGSYNAERRDV